jgi:hypothetical protein
MSDAPLSSEESNPKGYMVVTSDEISDLEQIVEERLAGGWQLAGGIAVAHGSYEGRKGHESWTQLYQAMVKR